MADTKISELDELLVLADADEFVVVDKDDTTMAASGTDKRVKKSTLDDLYDPAGAAAAAEAASQPLDADLSALAALNQTVFGRSVLEVADAADLRTLAELGTAATHAHGDYEVAGAAAAAQAASQPLDSDLTSIAAVATTAYGRALLALADAAAGRTALGAAASSHTHAQSDITSLTSDLALKAPLASPALTGNPTAPTASPGDNDTSIATTAFVADAVSGAGGLPAEGPDGDLLGVVAGVWASVTPDTDVDAADIDFTPVGTIAASDVQTAIAEVATDAAARPRYISILVTDPNGSALTTGDGKAYLRINSLLNGLNLTAVAAHVTTVSSSGIPTIQIANVTDTQDMLSTKLTIDQSEKDSKDATAAAVIDTAHDDVATGDELRIDVDVAGTGTKGLIVDLTFS